MSVATESFTRNLFVSAFQKPSLAATGFILAREACFWSGIAFTHGLVRDDETSKAFVAHTLCAGFVANVFDTCAGLAYRKSYSDFCKIYTRSLPSRLVSSVLVPFSVVKAWSWANRNDDA